MSSSKAKTSSPLQDKTSTPYLGLRMAFTALYLQGARRHFHRSHSKRALGLAFLAGMCGSELLDGLTSRVVAEAYALQASPFKSRSARPRS